MKKSNWGRRAPGFRGFILQLFLIIVLPLSVLLLVVAFGSQMLHHDAMRSLVGDRDLRTVRAAASSLEREVSHQSSTIQILSRSLNGSSDFSNLILSPQEIAATYDGGIATYSSAGELIRSSTSVINWSTIPTQLPEFFKTIAGNETQPEFSTLISSDKNSISYVLVGTLTGHNQIIVGAFSPGKLIQSAIGDLVSSGGTTILVIGPSQISGNYDVLYRGGPIKQDESSPSHPGIRESLTGEIGINYFQSSEGEHVVAFSPILPIGWGLVIEEAWEDIASPYLNTTQAAPFVIVPVFLLALVAIGFGARRIVTPLQKLEKQAANLASGDFEAIHQPVGGIEEIRNLQTELVEMSDKLKSAQQNLHSYIGAITAGVENERRSVARELHDDTIQSLIALNQRIQLILMNPSETQKGSVSELQDLVQKSMNNLRRMIRGLRPIYLEDLGLVASLEMLTREMEQSANIPISFISDGTEYRLDPQCEMSLYRMVQESLNNIIHHANAAHAWVEFIFTDTDLTIQIRDDGKGFVVPSDPAEFPKKGHFGLLGLQERSELINAKLGIVSGQGKGTTISIRLSNSTSQDHN